MAEVVICTPVQTVTVMDIHPLFLWITIRVNSIQSLLKLMYQVSGHICTCSPNMRIYRWIPGVQRQPVNCIRHLMDWVLRFNALIIVTNTIYIVCCDATNCIRWNEKLSVFAHTQISWGQIAPFRNVYSCTPWVVFDIRNNGENYC